MNLLKRLFIIVIGFIAFVFIISFFLPSSVKIVRKITIDTSSEIVFKQIDELKNWKNWTVWAEKDSTIFNKSEAFSSSSSGVGATFNWKSDNKEVGKGNVIITKSQPNESIETKLDFGLGESISYWELQQKEDVVEVTWGVNVDLGFNPIAKWFGLFVDKNLATNMEHGLDRLKIFSENLPKINSGIVTKRFIEQPQWYLGIRDTVDGTEIGTIHSKLFSEIEAFMENNNISTDLPPLTIYHFWSDTLVDLEPGIFIKDSIEVKSNRIKLNKISIGNVVTALHYGSYDRIPETYFSINEWMRKNDAQVIGPPWEVYIVDPSIEENPEKWVTEIYFPIN